jgi:CheY-like chemotaxis protein
VPLGWRTPRTLLVVEDEPHTRGLYRQALSSVGYRVIAVEDGLDALRHLEYDHVDAVVLDLVLPRVGGQDVYKEIRANPVTRHVPVVIVTGTEIRELEAPQFRYFLRKPFDGKALVAVVDRAIRLSGGPAATP